MNNYEKLKIPTIKEYELKLSPDTDPPMTSAYLAEACRKIFEEGEANNKAWLKARGFPADLEQAVRVAMADLFGEFVTDEEIGEFSMCKVWDLLETAYNRRRWLAKTSIQPGTDNAGWHTITQVAKGLNENKGTISRLITRGDLKDNGKSGTERRIDPASILAYCNSKGITYNDH